MPPKRPQYDRVAVPHRPACERTRDFEEVILSYSDDQALAEAQRCLQCYRPACEIGCPNHNPIKTFVRMVAQGQAVEAADMLWGTNAIPSCTGRVCAWERQCEGQCPLGRKGEPIAIGAIERYLAEKGMQAHGYAGPLDGEWPSGRAAIRTGDVAVVGAGPAGLSCANSLSREGIRVVVIEAWDAPGGVMSYGIPSFVLPKHAVGGEVERLRRQGVRFVHRTVVGRDVSVDELFAMGFKAVFIGVGASDAQKLGVPGEDLDGVVSAKHFLMDVAREQLGSDRARDKSLTTGAASPARLAGRRVVVIGAGNTAMDAARTALRLGAADVRILYRRAREHSPSRQVEMGMAEEEGVRFEFLVAPTRFIGERGRLSAIELVRMRLGAPDGSGRPSPEPVTGSEYVEPADLAILAVGYRVGGDVPRSTPGLLAGKDGRITVTQEPGGTTRPGVWAAGDCVTGANTVVHAVAAGREAAQAIARFLRGDGAQPAASR